MSAPKKPPVRADLSGAETYFRKTVERFLCSPGPHVREALVRGLDIYADEWIEAKTPEDDKEDCHAAELILDFKESKA
jgi:hypothetical protein